MIQTLAAEGIKILQVYVCPHHWEEGCACRKPKPGLLHEISDRLKVELAGAPVVGDSLHDLECADATGALPVLVKTGKGPRTWPKLEAAQAAGSLLQTRVFDDLAAFAESLLRGDLESAITACRGHASSD